MSWRSKSGLILFAVAGIASSAKAQWVGMSIHPGGNFSAAYGASSGIAVGNSGVGLSEAGYWTNGGSSYTSLHNNDWTSSIAFAGSTTMQVGGVQNPGNVHAARWFGTTASFEDMNPSRCSHSEAVTMFGNEFAGWGVINGENRGLVWHGGGKDDYTDLTPSWATSSSIYAMDGNQFVGYVGDANFNTFSGYWTNTADSFVDLTPDGASNAWIKAVAAGRQGGSYSPIGQFDRAALWQGSAASVIDLHPDAHESSLVNGMSANYQVGASFYQETFLRSHAAIWSGTKNSWVDIHDFLPAEFLNSEATSVVEYADRIEVYGYAYRGNLGDDRFAVMWVQPVPEPASLAVIGFGVLALARKRRSRA